MNDTELAQAAFQFLRRVQLNGDEALTYVAVMQWLEKKAQPLPQIVPHTKSANGAEAHAEV
jgi:hypothetical protein